MIVLRRCAMVKTVQPWKADLIVPWIRSSVFRSTAAVASSNTRIFVFLKRALAKQTNCFWPTLEREEYSRWIYKSHVITKLWKYLPLIWWTNENNTVKLLYLKCQTSYNLKLEPPSAQLNCSMAGWLATKFFRWACSRAFHNSTSVCFSKGSKFIRIVPEKRTGSCWNQKHEYILYCMKVYDCISMWYALVRALKADDVVCALPKQFLCQHVTLFIL